MQLARDNKLWVPDGDSWTNWSFGYETKHWNSIVPYITKTDVALDIGAHVGIWSRRMGRIFDKVYSFEPLTKHIECFNENLKGYDNVEIIQSCLSDEEGTKVMKKKEYNSGSSTLEWKYKSYKSKYRIDYIDVKTKTLDSYGIENIDLIKMDVERHEVNVIRGAEETLQNSSPIIIIEVLDRELKKDYTGLDALKDLGYSEIKYTGSGNYIYGK